VRVLKDGRVESHRVLGLVLEPEVGKDLGHLLLL
jgi:hypothetical protein